ncbi:MAG: amidohydrolase family protein [Planctomycetes bacterium]|nr:amidohydrolase family protein [Planctomycetota bacterium]
MKLLLENVHKLYDGTDSGARALHENVDLLLENGRVSALVPHRPGAPRDPAAKVVDCSRYTVTPGLIDCHGHVTILGLREGDIGRMNGPASALWVEKVLHTTLVDGGVTTLRDVGGATHWMKRAVAEGVMLGPRLKISVCMLSTTGGHADFRGPDRCHAELSQLWPPAPGRPSSLCDGPWECRKRVRELAACGADLIKVCASPGVASPGDKLEHREFAPEELAAICDEAKARGLRVAAHAHSASGIELALTHGVHDLQHISFLDARLVDLAHQKGATVTPTSWTLFELTRAKGLPAAVMEKVKQVNEHHSTAVRHALAGELPILMGTDAVWPGMHGRNWQELVHLVRDGVPPLRVWHGATGLAAREIGATDTGTLVPGQRADLLIASADVLDDPARFEHGALLEVLQDGLGHRGLAGVPQRTFAGASRAALEALFAESRG